MAHNSDLTLRIGIHIGDVIKKGGDVFGDGVNIASRLEPLAEPGGICVSERVHEDIKNKPEISTAFQEEQLLKGVDKPIKVYSIFTQMGTAEQQVPENPVLKKEIFNDETQHVCPKCNKHYPLTPRQRFDFFFGKDNYTIIDTPQAYDDPLDWPDGVYKKKLAIARNLTGQHCSVLVAQGIKDGIGITTFAIDSRFIGGSINVSS